MSSQMIQVTIFILVTAAIALLTYFKCKGHSRGKGLEGQNREFFLAGGGLKWYFVAGSITFNN